MKTIFKIVAKEYESKSMLPYTNAIERDLFLWELFHNFFRTYKHLEEDPSLEKIKEDLYKLKDTYKIIIND